ncbi:hypothetical protein EDD16DRAFT_1612356 [Pisolithus croceorrhizus]|nr:hypothetical protein EDD16DRAFT_1612356 [Pisolithus croceorrhizus]
MPEALGRFRVVVGAGWRWHSSTVMLHRFVTSLLTVLLYLPSISLSGSLGVVSQCALLLSTQPLCCSPNPL